jgi:hypothetical protein
MSIAQNPPPPLGPDWKPWGERLIDYLKRVRSKLPFFETGDSATEDGVMLWDTTGYPVISKGGEYRQIVLADGFGTFVSNTDQTTTANTATAISWDSMPLGDGVSIGNPIVKDRIRGSRVLPDCLLGTDYVFIIELKNAVLLASC